MDIEKKQIEKKVDNTAFRDKFRFLFSANDNIICERFFKINYFNNASLNSEELRKGINKIVRMIQNDMVSKSRIYTWYTTPTPVKLTGFVEGNEVTYVEYPEGMENNETADSDKNDDYTVSFKFEFQMAHKITTNPEDGKPIFSDYRDIYSAAWDGTVFPKYVRNNVDLSNSIASFKGCDISTMNFLRALNYRMVIGKQDLIYDIIKTICDITSGEGKNYTTSAFYGNGNILSEKEGKNLKKYEARYYDHPVVNENGFVMDTEYREVYRSEEGKCYYQREDGNYAEVVEYPYNVYTKYVKGWEEAVRDKTEAYRKSKY